MDDEKDKYETMCFVIMPIGELESHGNNHFRRVYEDIFCEAIRKAGYIPKRADDDKSSSMIHVEIIRDIVNAPMAICDLSTRNPNVLFELGIRQAFDLPVVLVQEEGTPRIFDISTINTIEYRRGRVYHEVLEDREKIFEAIEATKDNEKGINSIIKLLNINKAEDNNNGELTEYGEIKLLLYTLTKEIEKIKELNNHPDKYTTRQIETEVKNLRFDISKNEDEIKNKLEEMSDWEIEVRVDELEETKYSINEMNLFDFQKNNILWRINKLILLLKRELKNRV